VTTVVYEREVVTEWGIEPLPEERRPLGGWDTFALWLNLGISLLLLVAGALLVPGLGLRDALLATAVGVVLGNALLGLGAWIGVRVGVPSMVLLRAPLGIGGSVAPSVLNILQNIGWGAFELLIIAQSADVLTRRMVGTSSFVAWVAAFGFLTTLMAVGGPIVVVRQWLRKYAIWFVLASTVYLTVYALTRFDVESLWNRPGTGELPFWLGVNLVVAMPVSWIPLVADYTRFATGARAAFWGTALGYGLANFWFYHPPRPVRGVLVPHRCLLRAALRGPRGGGLRGARRASTAGGPLRTSGEGSPVGASIPSFLVAFFLHALLGSLLRRPGRAA